MHLTRKNFFIKSFSLFLYSSAHCFLVKILILMSIIKRFLLIYNGILICSFEENQKQVDDIRLNYKFNPYNLNRVSIQFPYVLRVSINLVLITRVQFQFDSFKFKRFKLNSYGLFGLTNGSKSVLDFTRKNFLFSLGVIFNCLKLQYNCLTLAIKEMHWNI